MDQAPIATHLERRLIDALTARAGYDPAWADGVVTSGGTQSNLMGLLLARDARSAAETDLAKLVASVVRTGAELDRD
jgi:L-2,4-diaminobutyrate decarboxylase